MVRRSGRGGRCLPVTAPPCACPCSPRPRAPALQVNCAWLGVASCVQLLIAMQLQFHSGHLEAAAVLAAAGLACLGAWVLLREHDTGG